MSDYTTQITSETTSDELEAWANEMLDDMDLDSTDEIEEVIAEIADVVAFFYSF